MLEPEFNIKTRDNYEPLISLEEFLSNRNVENTSIKDKLKESNKEILTDTIKLEEVLEKKYNIKNDYEDADILDKFYNEKAIKYELLVEDKDSNIIDSIQINQSGMMESRPPIITFYNRALELRLKFPKETESIIFRATVNEKEFDFKFNKYRKIISKSFYDERLEEYRKEIASLGKCNFSTETNFFLFTRDSIDSDYDYIILADYEDTMIFRDGKFRVEFGNFYDEMNKLDTESRYSTFSNVMGYCLD
tara:strand:+ start:54 stop:800 length:747 start_codon:yes stop_codon:yes gene_type:complete